MAQSSQAAIESQLTLTAYSIPITVIAQWPSPSAHPETRRWVIPFAAALQFLATLSIAIRFYAQLTNRIRSFGVDDIFIIAAWIIAVGFTACTIWGVLYAGYDRHIWDVLLIAQTTGLIAWVIEILFLASTCLTKLSVLLFQRRLLQRTNNPKIIRAIDCGIVFVVAYFIAFLLALIFSCTPIEAAWKSLDIRYQQPYTCRPRHGQDIVVGLISVLTDIYALIIPEMLVYSLRMERKQKALLYLIFGSGFIAAGAGIARTVWLSRLSTDRLRDMTWVGYELLVWSQVECQSAIVCASAPALKAFISKVKGSTARSKSDKSDFTPLTPLSKGRSNLEGTMEDDIADGKGILVTETLSLKSAQLTPGHANFRPSTNFSRPIDSPPLPYVEHGHPSISSETTLDLSFYHESAHGRSIDESIVSATQSPNDSWPLPQRYTQRNDYIVPVETYRMYNERDKAMKVLGG